MKALIKSIISQNKKFLHSINPHEALAVWNGEQLSGTPRYNYDETWEMFEVGYNHESDMQFKILLSEWPGIPEQGELMFLLDDKWKVAAHERNSDGSEATLLLQRAK